MFSGMLHLRRESCRAVQAATFRLRIGTINSDEGNLSNPSDNRPPEGLRLLEKLTAPMRGNVRSPSLSLSSLSLEGVQWEER